MKTTPAVGWVRANELPDREATLELLKLRKQVDDLKNELLRARTTAPEGTQDLAQGNELLEVGYSFKYSEPGDFKVRHYAGKFKTTWNEVFASVGPLMIQDLPEVELRQTVNNFLASRLTRAIQESGDSFSNMRLFQIDDSDYQTIKIQLRALGLIAHSAKARSVKDANTYWTLTPYGDDLVTRLRAIKRRGTDDTR